MTVADSEDGVVKGGTASFGVENTGSVGLEDSGVSLDGDSDGVKGEGSLEGRHGVLSNLDGASDIDVGVGIGSIVFARSLDGIVAVGGLGLGEVLLVVAEGEGLVTTIATEAGTDTVDELLLGEGEEFIFFDLPGTFEGTGGGESPA